MKTIMTSCAVLIIAAGAAAGEVVVRDGARAWRFAEVDGTSRLPLEYIRTGEDEDTREEVTLPRYWIAEEMVTEGDFAAATRRPVREGREATNAVTAIEWAEAREYCERFTKKYFSQFPTNCIASMPTAVEWAHAVRVLDGKADLRGEAGTFLFDASGGFRHTLWKGARSFENAAEENAALAWRYSETPKHRKCNHVGLRMVLVDMTKEFSGDNTLVNRGLAMLQLGFIAEGRRYLELAVAKGMLSSNNLEAAGRALDFSRKDAGYDYEDWSGLAVVSSGFAAKRGYRVEPFASGWMMRGWEEMENEDVAAEYEKCGVSGRWKRICDLPPEVRREQREGDTYQIPIEIGEDVQDVGLPIGSNTLVQVLACDFTGDGRKDMVVENFGSVGADGYWYGFYRQLSDGSYTNVLDLQTAGLCAVPLKDGGACGFLCVDKVSNPVLSVRLLSMEDGDALLYDAHERPFYILDVNGEHIYGPAPFIGAGYGFGWKHLESKGVWYRPLYWPWKAGTIQGFDEAQAEAERSVRKKNAVKEKLSALRAKWPHAGDRVSMWEMPNHAKRFFEIDRYQRDEWKNDDRASNEKMETLCREAVALKIEPSIWHYNLACALALQGKRDEAFGALEQSVAAGFYKVEHAREDEDLASLRGDARFDGLLELMAVQDLAGARWPKADAALTNGTAWLTADTVYLAFNDKSYFAELAGEFADQIFYMDRDGKNGAQVEGYLSVEYDTEGVWHGRHKGLANMRIRMDGVCLPGVARGTFSPEEIKTDAFDAVKTAQGSVLGLYSAEKHDTRLTWCILYRGGEAEGVALARLVREAFDAMTRGRVVAMLKTGGFAMTMTEVVHQAMKEGKDGNVIDVGDIDRDKLLRLAEQEDVWFMAGDTDIVTIAIRKGVSPEALRESNGLGLGEKVTPETVLRMPQP